MMEFQPTFTVGDLIQAAALLIAAAALVLTAIEMHRSTRQHRVQQIVELQNQFYADTDLMDVYYLIEYGDFRYEEDTFHDTPLEKNLDHLLVHFESIASLYEARVVSAKELDIVAYHYLVIYQNDEVRKYLAWLDAWSGDRGITESPFSRFRSVGEVVQRRRFRRRSEAALTTAEKVRASGDNVVPSA
jgi:hypothetical protein